MLQKGKKKTRDQISTDYWTFSPLFETDSKNYFLIFSEKQTLGEIDYSMHLLKKVKNNQFVYEENMGGYAVFY